MAPKRKATKADEQAEDAGVDTVDAPKKDMSKVPGGKAGGAASGNCTRYLAAALLSTNDCCAVHHSIGWC